MKRHVINLAHRIAWAIGRRGAVLLVLAIVFGLYGTLLLIRDAAIEPPRTIAVLLAIAPMRVWGVAWVGAAFLALVQALLGRLRVAAWAFASLTFMSGIWAAGYLAGWVIMEPPRDPRGWLLGVLWLCVFALSIILSGWREAPRPCTGMPSKGT